MKKVILIVSMLFLISCGGGSSGSNIPTTDNSTLTDLENEYGYYGDLVEVGGEQITNIWLVYTMEWKELGDFYFYANGTYKFSDMSGSYGVSKDGKSIYVDYNTLTLTSIESGTYSITNNGIEEQRNCLILHDGDENARLCPFK